MEESYSSDVEYQMDLLREIDAMGIEVTDWQANFIESILTQTYPVTPKQLEVIKRITQEYLPF